MHVPMAEPRFLGFLRGLPEKQVGADGGAEHRHDHQQHVAIELKVGMSVARATSPQGMCTLNAAAT